VLTSSRMLNNFPAKGGISDVYSPRTILMGETLDFKKHLALELGEYVQVHEEDKPCNGQAPHTKAAICMGLSGNCQGGYKFLALRTGKDVTCYSWTQLPMHNTVIAQVNELGQRQAEELTFTDRKNRPVGDILLPGVDSITKVDGNQNLDPIDYETLMISIPKLKWWKFLMNLPNLLQMNPGSNQLSGWKRSHWPWKWQSAQSQLNLWWPLSKSQQLHLQRESALECLPRTTSLQ
jgi:hypothetical protein